MKKEEFLAFSLPYELKIQVNREDGKDIITLNISQLYLLEEGYHFDDYKMIIRPLSDLTRKIEHKGEKFVPAKILVDEISKEWAKVGLSYPNDENMLLKDLLINVESVELWMALKLIEWHFDVAGLIGKGEAIDVNTLPENPYK